MKRIFRLGFGVSLLAFAGAASVRASETTLYTYDELGRVISARHTGTPNDGIRTNYSYDSAGNRSRVEVIGGPIVPQCFYSVHDNLNGVAGNSMTFQITRTGSNCRDNVEINYNFTDGTAIEDQHFSSSSNYVQFSPSTATSRYIYVDTVAGISATPVEFTVNIVSYNEGDAVVDGTATGRISPPPPCTFYAANTQVTAGYNMTFNLYRTASCAPDQTVQYSTSDEDAIAGTHYIAKSGNATFSGTSNYMTVDVATIAGSVTVGNARYFRLNVSSSDPAIQPSFGYARGKIHAPGDD